MNRHMLLDYGAQMRQMALAVYRHHNRQDAAEVCRRMIFEIGEVMGDLHGRADAAAAVYSAADALADKAPLEDFRLLLINEKAVAAPEEKPKAKRLGHFIGITLGTAWRFVVTWQFLAGFWLGVLFGMPTP